MPDRSEASLVRGLPKRIRSAEGVFDMACGWPMYRVPSAGSYRYKCGCYQQSHGQECSHNHVDGPQAARFVLSCIRRRLGGAFPDQLKQRLRNLAAQDAVHAAATCRGKLSTEAELNEIREELKTASRNLAMAKTSEQYEAVSAVFDDLKAREAELATQLCQWGERPSKQSDPEVEVEKALAVLSHLEDLMKPDHEQNTRPILDLVNARLFLSFKSTQIQKRLLNKLEMAVVTMGDAPPPVKLYSGPTGRRGMKKSTAMVAVVAGEPSSPVPPAGGEAISLGNVNRGDKTPLELFIAGVQGLEAVLRRQFDSSKSM